MSIASKYLKINLTLLSTGLTLAASAVIPTSASYISHNTSLLHNSKSFQTVSNVGNMGATKLFAEADPEITSWKCILEGKPVGQVDIWGGQTKVDAAEACDSKISQCGENGGCSAIPNGRQEQQKLKLRGLVRPAPIFPTKPR